MVLFDIIVSMNVSEPDGCHDLASIFIMLCIFYRMIYIVGLIVGPRHVFVPHPRHENVATLVENASGEPRDGNGVSRAWKRL